MTFFMIGGIVCIAAASVLVIVYLIAHKLGDESPAAKIIIWSGLMFGVAGASLLTIEYSFPNLSHPELFNPTVYDHFIEYLNGSHIKFIELNVNHKVDNVINETHNEIFAEDKEDEHVRLYDTNVIYLYNNATYKYNMISRYEYNNDYSVQQITHYNYGKEV